MAHRAWLRSAGLSPDGRPPHAGADPLRVTLCLTRACDRLVSVHLVDAGHHRRPTCAGATAFAATWPSLSIEYVQVGDLHRVCLQGELDISSASAVRDRLVEVAGSTVEVDLSNLRFIDARGLGALVAAKSRVTSQGHQLRIVGASGLVRRVFEVTELDVLLDD